MSNTDNGAEKKPAEQEEWQTQPLIAKALYRQFSTKLVTLLLTFIVVLTLISTLFYQQSERSRFLIEGELIPLKQQFEQLQALHKAAYLVNELLFIDSGMNFVKLQTELIAVNRQLLRLKSSNTHLYQQWLNANKSANDIVVRIQQTNERNEQLKQSSIIQLQLMWFSVTQIINKKTTQQELLFKQLQADKINDKLTLSRANAYVSAISKLHHLQQLKSLLAEVLTRFEQLTIHTNIENFDLLRLGVEQIITQRSALKIDDKTKAMVDFDQQIRTFEAIVLTEKMALVKWHSYIRLIQNHQFDLTIQNNQLIKLLAEPQEKKAIHVSGVLNDWLIKINDKFNVNVTQEALSITLLLAIILSLLFLCYLLWFLREQIKVAAQQSELLIDKNIPAENSGDVQANGAKTLEVMPQVQSLAKPAHNEQAQALLVYTQTTNPPLIGPPAKDNKEAVFDFGQFLHYQGSIELALFMLDDYTQGNHQQLDTLIDAIKAKDFDKAKEVIIDLQFNAKILVAVELAQLCSQWLTLLCGNDLPNSVKEMNVLLKETRAALTVIDNYAESI